MIEFKNGEVWTYKTRAGESDSRLIIVDSSLGFKGNKTVHISITGIAVRNSHHQDGMQNRIAHLAVFASALRASVLECVGTSEISQDSLEQVASWKALSDGLGFLVPIAQCLDIVEFGIQRAAVALPSDKTPEDWCLGLPLIEERPLTTGERTQLEQRFRRHRRKGSLLLALSFGTSVLPLLIYRALGGEGAFARSLFALSMLSCLYIGFTFPAGLVELIQAKKLATALRVGIVRCFEGLLSGHSFPKTRRARVLKKHLRRGVAEKQLIELLAPSNIVLKVNGSAVLDYIRLRTGRVSRPGFSRMSTLVTKYSSALGMTESMEYRKRHLTQDEIQELKNHRAQIYWRVSWLGLLRLIGGAGAMLGLLLAMSSQLPWSPDVVRNILRWVPLMVGVPLALRFAYYELRFAYELRKAEKIGFIIIFDAEHSPSNAPMQETLAYRRIAWTSYGKPARWRILLGS